MVGTSCGIQRYYQFIRWLPTCVLEPLRNTPFNSIIDIENLPIDHMLIKVLTERFDTSTNSFIIGNQSVTFPLSDISIILGLNVSIRKRNDYIREEKKGLSLCDRYFCSKEIINLSDIEDSFHKASPENIEDIVKLSMLFILCVLLLPNDGETIDSIYCDMVDDEDMRAGIPWGLIVHNHLMKSISQSSVLLNSTGLYHSPDGCVFALQIWAYEHIPILAPFRQKVDIIPRCLSYSEISFRNTNFYHASLSNPNVILKLDLDAKNDNEAPRKPDKKITKEVDQAPNGGTCESLIEEKRALCQKDRKMKKVGRTCESLIEEKITIFQKDRKMKKVNEVKKKEKKKPSNIGIDEFKPSRYCPKDLKSINVFHLPLHPLVDEDISLIESYLNMDSNITLPSGLPIYSLKCLSPMTWLDGEVIEAYCILLKQRELAYPSKFKSCHYFTPMFVELLRISQCEINKNLLKMSSHTQLKYKISDCDRIFIPLNKVQSHWGLLVINVKEARFEILDSLQSQTLAYWEEEVNLVAMHLDSLLSQCGANSLNCSSWSRCFLRNIPLQKNWFDCGMFVLKYMDYISRGLNLTFDQDDMPYFRQRIAVELIREKAVP